VFHLILAMTVFWRYGTHAAQEPGSLFWCQYHAVITSAPLPAKAGFETWERNILLLFFISWQ